ncbi:hypothetical protein ACFWDI_40420 [Streptomyces sp. NPDC060064]|uniref:hypothetical protein n=1 Tax=Streptomyces sp. NPDC060064 TaxID=3347049 RepID=UPI0036B3E804
MDRPGTAPGGITGDHDLPDAMYWFEVFSCALLCWCDGSLQKGDRTETVLDPPQSGAGKAGRAGKGVRLWRRVVTVAAALAVTAAGVAGLAAPPAAALSPGTDAAGTHAPAGQRQAHKAGEKRQPDLLLVAKSHQGDFIAGGQGVYTITVTNPQGISFGRDFTVTDPLPEGLTAASFEGTDTSFWRFCDVGPPVTCYLPDYELQAYESLPPITLIVNVASNASGQVTNNVSVSTRDEYGSSRESASGSDPTTILPASSSLLITKSHPQGDFNAGSLGSPFTITVSNSSPGPTSGTVTVTDDLSPEFHPYTMAGNGWTCVKDSLTCTRSDPLAPGASYPPITLTVSVDPAASAPATNRATVANGGSGAQASDLVTINAAAQPAPWLWIDKTHGGDFTPGHTGVYTFLVSNQGNAATTGTVTVADTALPDGLTVLNMGGGGWNCPDLATLTCTFTDSVAAGDSFPPLVLLVTVDPDATGPFVNTVTVSGGGSTPDQDIDPVILARPSLQIDKTHQGEFVRGGRGQYTITVTNNGQAPTRGQVTVTDSLPQGLRAAGLEGEGWHCDTATLACTRTDALPPGGHYPPITLKVKVNRKAPCTVVNTVTVTGGRSAKAQATDPTPVNRDRPGHGHKDPRHPATEHTTTPTTCH